MRVQGQRSQVRPRRLGAGPALLVGVGLAAALAGCRAESQAQRKSTTVIVEAGPPRVRDVEVTLRYPIELSAAEKVSVSPVAISGHLTQVRVDVGDKVTAGQLIAEVDCREYVAQRRQTEQAIARWQAQLEQARAQLSRLKTMDEKKLLAPAELDQARATAEVTAAQLADARAKLAEATQRQGYCRLRAPFDGFVAERFLDPGAMVRPGGRPVVTIVKTQNVRVVIPVLEQDIPKIQRGAEVRLVLHALPTQPLRGHVVRIGRQLDLTTRTLPVEIDLPNTTQKLLPGMTGRAAIVIGRRPNALLVPVTAVLNLEEASYVFVVVNGKASRRQVELGEDLTDWIEIRKGLKPTDTVIVTGRELVAEGTPVEVVPPKRRRRAVTPPPKPTPDPAPLKTPDEATPAEPGTADRAESPGAPAADAGPAVAGAATGTEPAAATAKKPEKPEEPKEKEKPKAKDRKARKGEKESAP